jgi:hypothetical protein
MKISLQQQRILAGQCPLCGNEAAPYRLCYNHRLSARMNRTLKRGVRLGALKIDNLHRYSIGTGDNDGRWGKWGTKIVLPESDKRGRPKLRGIQVDVEETLVKIMERIGRPCTVDEISAAWGKLRDRRYSPLASDLATIIAARDKRARKMERRAKQAARSPKPWTTYDPA